MARSYVHGLYLLQGTLAPLVPTGHGRGLTPDMAGESSGEDEAAAAMSIAFCLHRARFDRPKRT